MLDPDSPRPAPPLDALQLRLLPVADLFMVLMWSRPASGTLRDTPVTLASILLGLVTFGVVGAASIGLLGHVLGGGHPLWLVVVLLGLVVAVGALVVSVFGVRQRLLARGAAR
ncbi:MAG: hypothetical protein QOE92_1120 [Chloroflexota bacterium]|jgi:hypothetical protein|nr:hypothetical protein [Chloroflexota bacterium]